MARTASTSVAKAKIALPANITQMMAAEAASITNRIGQPSGNRVKTTLKKTFKLPSGEEAAGPMQAIIVDFVSANYYYDKNFDPNDITPPLCAAIGTDIASLTPFLDSPEKQCETCAACAMNQFGSNGKGKACQNTYLLALLPPDADAETPLMTMKVSATARRSFDGYVASIARSFNAPPLAVVTEIGFDQNLDYPSLRFNNPSPASKEVVELAFSRRDEARALLSAKPDFAALEAAKAAPAKKAATRRGR